ncbi:hypothetical protein BC941DRAFT_343535 [Chlamydoabsidia padenii]|nr:hypothetical protein BC941DRAFT_343535 [Chlamydoabsidia padenii]
MSSEQICVITNGDSLCGFALAYRFLEEFRNKNHQCKLRVLCRNKQDMDQLRHMGADVREVDYNQEDKVREHLQHAKAVVLIPEHDQHRMREGENVIKAAKKEKVEHLCMLSLLGVQNIEQANDQQQFKTLKQYYQLEEKVKETMGHEKFSIVRLPIPAQMFYFLAPYLESQNQLPLPIKKDKKWNTVDLQDILEAIVKLAKKNQQQGFFEDQKNKQELQFTPRQNYNMEELTKQIGQGLGNTDIKFKQVSHSEMEKMLREMRDDKRFKHRPESSARHDKPYTFPLGRYLNNELIQTLCEIWELANQGCMDIVTNDLKELLGRDPQDIQSFFKNNRDQFHDLR